MEDIERILKTKVINKFTSFKNQSAYVRMYVYISKNNDANHSWVLYLDVSTLSVFLSLSLYRLLHYIRFSKYPEVSFSLQNLNFPIQENSK